MLALPRQWRWAAALARWARFWTAWRDRATIAAVNDWTDTGYERGRRARAAILAELRRGEDAGEDAPSLRELARAIGLPMATTHRHLVILRRAGLVSVDAERGEGVELTRAGRRATD